ncbi:hypothetical protein [Streptomyces phage phiScoe1]|nr:hypothetical protein [Streptomyces phage phiScoe1]
MGRVGAVHVALRSSCRCYSSTLCAEGRTALRRRPGRPLGFRTDGSRHPCGPSSEWSSAGGLRLPPPLRAGLTCTVSVRWCFPGPTLPRLQPSVSRPLRSVPFPALTARGGLASTDSYSACRHPYRDDGRPSTVVGTAPQQTFQKRLYPRGSLGTRGCPPIVREGRPPLRLRFPCAMLCSAAHPHAPRSVATSLAGAGWTTISSPASRWPVGLGSVPSLPGSGRLCKLRCAQPLRSAVTRHPGSFAPGSSSVLTSRLALLSWTLPESGPLCKWRCALPLRRPVVATGGTLSHLHDRVKPAGQRRFARG